MPDDQHLYKFRWTNIDLERYVENRKAKATVLRCDAAKLITQAEAIEEEADQLSRDLIQHEADNA